MKAKSSKVFQPNDNIWHIWQDNGDCLCFALYIGMVPTALANSLSESVWTLIHWCFYWEWIISLSRTRDKREKTLPHTQLCRQTPLRLSMALWSVWSDYLPTEWVNDKKQKIWQLIITYCIQLLLLQMPVYHSLLRHYISSV